MDQGEKDCTKIFFFYFVVFWVFFPLILQYLFNNHCLSLIYLLKIKKKEKLNGRSRAQVKTNAKLRIDVDVILFEAKTIKSIWLDVIQLN